VGLADTSHHAFAQKSKPPIDGQYGLAQPTSATLPCGDPGTDRPPQIGPDRIRRATFRMPNLFPLIFRGHFEVLRKASA
jgi:hypothetical protein